MNYYTSDLHFGHKNVLLFGNRPYDTVEEMDEALIDNWNKRVRDKDHVYILGDFMMSKDVRRAEEILGRLKGKKTLVLGNHDHFVKKQEFNKALFEEIVPYKRVNDGGRVVILCHYPILEWDQKHRGSIHLFGHIHAKPLLTPEGSYNVGVDVRDWKPVLLEEVLEVYGI